MRREKLYLWICHVKEVKEADEMGKGTQITYYFGGRRKRNGEKGDMSEEINCT